MVSRKKNKVGYKLKNKINDTGISESQVEKISKQLKN